MVRSLKYLFASVTVKNSCNLLPKPVIKSNLVNIVLPTEKSDLLGSFYVTRDDTLYDLVATVGCVTVIY